MAEFEPAFLPEASNTVVWRLGISLLETPQLLSCVGVAPLGLELAGSVQPLPWFSLGPMEDPVCQGRHLRWFVRAEVTAPNAPKQESSYFCRSLLMSLL